MLKLAALRRALSALREPMATAITVASATSTTAVISATPR